jgi:hypothetical protein
MKLGTALLAVPLALGAVGPLAAAAEARSPVPAAVAATSPPARREPAPPKPVVRQGESYYDQTRFDDAITLLRDLVQKGAMKPEAELKAREILARCYVKKGYPALGRDMFRSMLRLNPGYRPNPVQVPPDEAAVFQLALREYQTEVGQSGAGPGASAPATASALARGTLEVKARPFASVYLGDSLVATNVTGTRLNVPAGSHRVRVVHPAYEPREWKVTVAAGGIERIAQDFGASSGSIRVSTGGVWAEVFLDGKSTGKTTPCVLEGLSDGAHTVSVARAGFVTEGGPLSVTVKPGASVAAAFQLKPTRVR